MYNVSINIYPSLITKSILIKSSYWALHVRWKMRVMPAGKRIFKKNDLWSLPRPVTKRPQVRKTWLMGSTLPARLNNRKRENAGQRSKSGQSPHNGEYWIMIRRDWAPIQNDSRLAHKSDLSTWVWNINRGHTESTSITQVKRWTRHVNPYLCRWADRHSSLRSCLSLWDKWCSSSPAVHSPRHRRNALWLLACS